MIFPLAFYGLGTADSLLNMKMYELRMLKGVLQNKDIKDLYYGMRGLKLED